MSPPAGSAVRSHFAPPFFIKPIWNSAPHPARPALHGRVFFFHPDDMNPDRAVNEQIERYRRMTGEQRLRIALELHELSCNVAREGIRRQNPNADEAEVEHLLRRRLELARQ